MTKSIIRLLSLTAAMLAVSGCIEELSPDFGSEPQLVLNADLMTGRTEHAVYLTVGTPEGLVAPASDSRILCYVNGELVAEDSQGDVQEYEEQFLVFDISADFKAGDRVKLVAESGDMSSYAENVFPEPLRSNILNTVDYLLNVGNPEMASASFVKQMHFISAKTGKVDKDIFSTVFLAWRNHRMLSILYKNNKDEITQRIIEPHALFFRNSTWYIQAFCHERKKDYLS